MKFGLVILQFLLLGQYSSAAPVQENVVPRAPPLPTLEECKSHLKVEKDTALFYGGSNGNKQARKWVKDHPEKSSYLTLADQYTDRKWADQWQSDEKTSRGFFNIVSRAYAELSTGTVYTMLDEGSGYTWRKGGTWDAHEWPYFGDVTIIRLNAAGTEEIIKGPGSKTWPSYTPGSYAKGHCALRATQWDLDPKQLDENRYDIEVSISSNSGSADIIGYHPPMNAGPQHPLRITSKLADIMEVTPEIVNDYVQFTVGSTSWKSSDAGCKVDSWDKSSYPSYRKMECGFPC